MNWYILYVLSYKAEQLLPSLNGIDFTEAFIPKYEYYHRKTKQYEIKPMFGGYIFIKSSLDQLSFNDALRNLEQKNGILKQLVKKETSALTDYEIDMFEKLLDTSYIIRMSQAYIQMEKQLLLKDH